MPLERLAPRPVLRSVSRLVLLACLICPVSLIGSLIRSPFPRRLAFFSSAHRLAPCLVSPGSPPHRQAKRGGTIGERSLAGGHRRCADDGERMAASACLPRMETTEAGGGCLLASDGDRKRRADDGWIAACCGRRAVIDGGWLRAAGVVVAACLPRGDGRSGSIVPRSFLFSLSSAHPTTRPRLISSSHRRGGTFFSFSPDPLSPALLDLLAWVCSPVPGRGMRELRHGLRRRACGLFACVLIPRAALSLPLVRSLLYDLCQSCRSFLPGVLCGVLWVILPAILSALAFLNICP